MNTHPSRCGTPPPIGHWTLVIGHFAQLLPLCAGLALGSAGARALLRVAPDSAGATLSASPATYLNAAPTLILPQLLAGAEADAALAAYLALPALPDNFPATETQERLARLHALLTLLPTAHIDRLLTALATHPGRGSGQLRRAAFEIWTERDAPAAARWAAAVVPGETLNTNERSRLITQAALAWARDDFSTAYAWVSAIPDAPFGRDLANRLLAQLAATDPRQALALSQAGGDEFFRATQVGVFRAWAKHDPAAAVRALGPSLLAEQSHDVHNALATWAARDPSSALDWIIAQPVAPDNNSHLLNNVGWSLANSPAAVRPFIELLMSRETVPNRSTEVQNLFAAWARKDTRGALAWIGTITDVAQRSDLVEQSLNRIDQNRPDDFLTFARLLPASADRDEKISTRLATWAEADPNAALAWLSKNNAPELATFARKIEGTLIATLAKTDPAAAVARWQSLPADAAQGETAAKLATHWARTDPAAATRWFASLIPADPLKYRTDPHLSFSLQSIATHWARQDPLGLLKWSESLPTDSQREMVINSFAHISANYSDREPDPPPRASFANQLAQIQDPAIRERTLSSHLSHWLRSDLKAAQAWIESSEALSPETAARLLTQDATAH